MTEKKKKEKKSAYDMTDEEVVKVVDPFLDISDFNDDGSDIETLRDILEGNE
jgi:hypothetical protein